MSDDNATTPTTEPEETTAAAAEEGGDEAVAKPTFSFGGGAAKKGGSAPKFTFGGFGGGAAKTGDKPKFSFGGFRAASAGGAEGGEGAAAPAAAGDNDEMATNPQAKALVHLEDVEVKTHEEDEDILLEKRARLYRMAKAADTLSGVDEWKERGTGQVKLLKHQQTDKIRLLMRREKIFKICANHYIFASMELQQNPSSDKSWMWTAVDSADGEPSQDLLCIRFKTLEDAEEFKAQFEAAGRHNAELGLGEGTPAADGDEATATAEAATAEADA